MTTYKKMILFSLIASFFFSVGMVAIHAQVDTGNPANNATGNSNTTHITLSNPFSGTCGNDSCGLVDLLQAIINNILLPIGGVLAVLGFVWSGFMYVMAQGNPAAITKATQAFKFTVIGTALLLGAYAIADVIAGTLHQFGGPTGLK